MLRTSRAPCPSPRYEIGSTALPAPRVEDVSSEVADLLPAFTDDALRTSYRAGSMSLDIGALRAREMFPRSSRFDARELVAWHNRTRATLSAADAFDVLCEPAFACLMPYVALSVRAFGEPLKSVIAEMEKRLALDPHGFSVLWIAAGRHISPLHHDGSMVHGRWHLAVRGTKQFDFMPPGSRRVPRLPPWDLFRRFSPIYRAPLPDAWLADEAGDAGGCRVQLNPGQMVAWGRRWWHRVEVGHDLTIGISTRGHRQEDRFGPHTITHLVGSWIVGEAEHHLDRLGCKAPARTLEEMWALRASVS
jgi:hypothetical protein